MPLNAPVAESAGCKTTVEFSVPFVTSSPKARSTSNGLLITIIVFSDIIFCRTKRLRIRRRRVKKLHGHALFSLSSDYPLSSYQHRVSKNTPTTSIVTRKRLPNFNNFSMNIPDATNDQITVQVPTSPNVCFCTT